MTAAPTRDARRAPQGVAARGAGRRRGARAALALCACVAVFGCGPVRSGRAVGAAADAVRAAQRAPADRVDVYARTRAEVLLAEARARRGAAAHEDAIRLADEATGWARRAVERPPTASPPRSPAEGPAP